MLSLSPSVMALPPGPVLFLSLVLDNVFQDWRSYLPLLIGNSETGYMGKYRILDCMKRWYSKNTLLSYEQFSSREQGLSTTQAMVAFLRADNTVLGDLCSPTSLCLALPILVVCMRSLKRFVEPRFSALGRQLGRNAHGVEWEKHNEERITKFGEYVFRLLFHSALSVWGMYYIGYVHRDWWTNTRLFFQNHPSHVLENQMIWYYLIQCAYNIEALLRLLELSLELRNPFRFGGWSKCIVWAKTVRGDFREMCIHHIATNALIMLSSSFALTRAGSVIMVIHDISDVPVDLSKLANFVKWKTTTTVCFATMCLVWLATRLGFFPLVVIRSTIFDTLLLINEENMEPELFYSVYWIFMIFVFVIFALHCTWFVMLIKIGYLLLLKGEAHDLSEHKHGEKQHQYPVGKSKKTM